MMSFSFSANTAADTRKGTRGQPLLNHSAPHGFLSEGRRRIDDLTSSGRRGPTPTRTTHRYDRDRHPLDRDASYAVASWLAEQETRRSLSTPLGRAMKGAMATVIHETMGVRSADFFTANPSRLTCYVTRSLCPGIVEY